MYLAFDRHIMKPKGAEEKHLLSLFESLYGQAEADRESYALP